MQFFKDIQHIFFPNICVGCDNILTSSEKHLCAFCLHQLPTTQFTLNNDKTITKMFYGRLQLENATALLFYTKKGIVQKLIHQLKYRGNQEIGSFLGAWLGKEMFQSKLYENIDFIIPVPLHSKRFEQRGYNQVTTFGKQLSKELKVPFVNNILIRKRATKTQTNKIRLDRWNNKEELFFVTDQNQFMNKRVLLIDDVITTGATLEMCCNEINKLNNVKISIAVMAITN